MEFIRFHRQPELVDPVLIAAWPGVGNVALIAATYLKDELEAGELAELDPTDFFDVGGVFIKDNLIDIPRFPEGRFYYWQSEGRGRDLIIFLAEGQPASGSYKYVNQVLDVARRFGVKRVYTIAAALTEHYPDRPRVLGAASSPELLDELSRYDVTMAGDFYIAGLNGLLLGVASDRGFESICLLGETVKYAAKMANPGASQEVLKVLLDMLDLEIDMTELAKYAASTDKELRQFGAEIKKEFLENFTKPIWERDKHEENG